MKFGVFLPNGSDGYMITKAIKPYPPTWELNRDVTIEAEKQGLDFVLSMMKFRGFGGETGYWDECMESFTLMASLASVTDRIGLIPTVTLLAQHPAYVARMMATLDGGDSTPFYAFSQLHPGGVQLASTQRNPPIDSDKNCFSVY